MHKERGISISKSLHDFLDSVLEVRNACVKEISHHVNLKLLLLLFSLILVSLFFGSSSVKVYERVNHIWYVIQVIQMSNADLIVEFLYLFWIMWVDFRIDFVLSVSLIVIGLTVQSMPHQISFDSWLIFSKSSLYSLFHWHLIPWATSIEISYVSFLESLLTLSIATESSFIDYLLGSTFSSSIISLIKDYRPKVSLINQS